MTVLDTEAGTAAGTGVDTSDADSPQTIDFSLSLPVATVLALKRATAGRLDAASAAALVLQLYASAPLDQRAVVLTSGEFGRLSAALGFSPQTNDELIGGVEQLTRISFGGVHVKFTAEDVALVNARNASGLSPRDFAQHIVQLGFDAWKNGVIG